MGNHERKSSTWTTRICQEWMIQRLRAIARLLDLSHVKNQTLHTEWNKAERWVYRRGFDYEPGNSRLLEPRVLSCSQTSERILLGANAEVAWLFSWLLSSVLLPYLDQGSWVRGTKTSKDDMNRLGIWELAGVLCWFLKRAVNSCNLGKIKFCFSLMHPH